MLQTFIENKTGKLIEYDDTLYEVIDAEHCSRHLHYIGPSDVRPVIPEGCTDCYKMFANTSIKYAPIIPEGVICTLCMFERCYALTEAPVIPESAEEINGMFRECISLKYAPEIPKNVRWAMSTFSGCIALEKPPVIKSKILVNTILMFAGCHSLKSKANLLNKPEKDEKMYTQCHKLKE